MNTFLKQLLKICVAFVALFICVAFVHSLFYVSLKSPKPTFLLLDRNLQFLAELGNDVGTFGYWPLPDTLPNRLVKMTLAAEDHRFYSHLGVDVRSIGRALWQNYLARQSYSGVTTRTFPTELAPSFASVWT